MKVLEDVVSAPAVGEYGATGLRDVLQGSSADGSTFW